MFWRKKKILPEVYSENELDALETHIEKYYGKYTEVFHEVVSPDIHVDICLIEPTIDCDCYTLVTMGMGAHKMNVPRELKNEKLDRAELLITLPSDWDINNDDERWYWPLRWLKILARLPIENDTWLGYGHSIPAGEPLSDDTELSGLMLTMPYLFGIDAAVCKMPSGDEINFYQLLPLYDNEMDFKLNNSAEELEDLFPEDFDLVVDVNRGDVIGMK